MTIGVGGNTKAEALSSLSTMTEGLVPISRGEYQQRIERAQAYMQEHDIAAAYFNAGTNMSYFTGTQWRASERMVGMILPATGDFEYIAPYFEKPTLEDYMVLEGKVNTWHEHESPYELFIQSLKAMGIASGTVGICESAAVFIYDGILQQADGYRLINAGVVSKHCRTRKSSNELMLMSRVKQMTLEVHKATASMLKEGMSTTEVEAFIDEAHRKVGAPAGSYFVIVLFGEASAYPHGVKDPQILKEGDMVLIDTGCQYLGYISDITRSYVFGEPTERQRSVWNAEKEAQLAAFNAAQLGTPCAAVDQAARDSLAANGFGPGYDIPGLPHRTGHGIGMDIHEWPYLVGSDQTPLDVGMCFSNEPMICIPGEFGIRHEDHFYMTESGPEWFTEPSHTVDDPFKLESVS